MGLALQRGVGVGEAAAGVDQFLSNEDPVFMQTSSALKQKQIPPRERPGCQDTFLSGVLRLRDTNRDERGIACQVLSHMLSFKPHSHPPADVTDKETGREK